MHAADKLQEARFFLGELRKRPNNRPEFRFYMSAFLSAARSVTFALQKDYRSRCGDLFDRWYTEKKGAINAHPMGPVVNRARSIFQKEGNKLYCRSTYSGDGDNAPTLVIEYDLETVPLSLQSVKSIGVEFPQLGRDSRTSRVRRLFRRLFRKEKWGKAYWAGIVRGPGETDDQAIRRWVTSNFERLIADMGRLVEGVETKWEVALVPDGGKVQADRLLGQLESYLSMLEGLVEDASARFEAVST